MTSNVLHPMTVSVELSDVIMESETRSLSADRRYLTSLRLSVIYIHCQFFQIFFFFVVTNRK